MKKILFTGGGGAGNEALFRLLGDRYEMHFADADVQAIDPAIPADRRHAIPFAHVPNFGKKLCELFHTLEMDLLVPGVDEELLTVAELAEAGKLKALLPPKRFVALHLDKFTSAQKLGGFAPKTVLAEESEQIGFPCIVKPRRGRGSRGVALIQTLEKLNAYLAYHGGADGWIAQARAQGEEFTVMMAADSAGILRAVVPVAVEVKRGITLRAHTCRNRDVEEACRAVHQSDPVPGCYNIQLIREADGRILIFEINPRVSTTMCLGVAAGIDPVRIFMEKLSAENAELLPFKENLSLRRTWLNHFQEGAST